MAMQDVKSIDVVVVGEIFADHILTGFERWPRPGEEAVATGYAREAGGGTVNTACGLARLGRRVQMVGVIGEADADWFSQRMSSFGVDMGAVRLAAEGTGLSVAVSMRDDRTFFTYPGANASLPDLLSTPSLAADLAAARHVHFAMPLSRMLAREILPVLKASGCSVSLDVGHTPEWLQDAGNIATCREVDLFLPNAAEAALACGAPQAEAYVAWAMEHGLPRIVLKRGSQGALCADDSGLVAVAPPVIEVLDTTGAGDAFNAGLIDAWLDGQPLGRAIQSGCVCGALCSTAAGALHALPDSLQMRTLRERTYRS